VNHEISQANQNTLWRNWTPKIGLSSITNKKNQAKLANAIHLQLKKISKKKSLRFDYKEWPNMPVKWNDSTYMKFCKV